MATSSPMTANWNWKLGVTGAAALAGWLGLGSPAHLDAPDPRPQAAEAPRDDARLANAALLAEQARHLDEHLAAVQVPPTTRNLFRFGERPAPRRVIAPRPAVVAAPPAPAPAPFPLRLTGIAVDVVNGIATRTAILSGPSGVELAAAGEAAAPGYRVIDVGDSFAEVERSSDGARERLTLRP